MAGRNSFSVCGIIVGNLWLKKHSDPVNLPAV